VVIMATIPLLKRGAREHDRTAVSLWFSGRSPLYRISVMGVFSCYYHLFNQNVTGRHDSAISMALLGLLLSLQTISALGTSRFLGIAILLPRLQNSTLSILGWRRTNVMFLLLFAQ